MNRASYQKSVLAWLVQDELAMEQMEGRIKEEHFEDNHLKFIFSVLSKSWEKRSYVPTEEEMIRFVEMYAPQKSPVVAAAVVGKIHEIYHLPVVATGDQVRQFVAHQELRQAALRVLDQPLESVHETAEDLKLRMEKLDPLLLATSEKIKSFDEDTFDEEWWQDYGSPPLPLGYKTIDSITRGGGMQLGEMVTVLATPGVGKTMTLTDMLMRQVEQGRRGFMFSFDNTRNEISRRLVARMSGRRLEDETTLDEARAGIAAWRERYGLEKGMLIVQSYPPHHLTVSDCRRILRQAERKYGKIDVVVYDYMDQVLARKKYNARREELADISRGMKYIGRDLEMLTICATQGNREALRARTLNMSHMSECHDKNFESNLTLALCQTEAESTLEPPQLRIAIAKHTKGIKKNIEIPFIADYSRMRLEEDTTREIRTVASQRDIGEDDNGHKNWKGGGSYGQNSGAKVRVRKDNGGYRKTYGDVVDGPAPRGVD